VGEQPEITTLQASLHAVQRRHQIDEGDQHSDADDGDSRDYSSQHSS
jgi:hypothetical protein